MPAVSVIVPVYNVEKYIERCARALFGQTLEDMEFVFVDDCTPDLSMEILAQVLEEYPGRKPQVKIVTNEVHLGTPATRRKGVGIAAGDYIIHCDSDDWPQPDMYGKLYSKAVSEDLDMVMCGVTRVLPDRPSTHLCGPVATDDLVESLLRQDILFFPVNKLFRRSVYGHDIKYSVHNMLEDAPMTVQLAYYCRSWGFVDEYLYNYCYRPGSVTDAEDTPEKLWQMKANVDMVISFLEGKGLSRKYRKAIITLKDWMRSRGRDLPRSYYMKLYPEINIPFLFDRDIPVMERLGHLTTLLGIHGISKPFRRK